MGNAIMEGGVEEIPSSAMSPTSTYPFQIKKFILPFLSI
jgi:hypothetical protein